MNAPASIMTARLHGVLAGRPSSPVVHVVTVPRSRRTGRLPRNARSVAGCRTSRLYEVDRDGVVIDLGGRRLCKRCEVRLVSLARALEQPPAEHDARVAFWQASGVTSTDLVIALALATTEAETYAISEITNAIAGRVHPSVTRRPSTPGKAQGRWDFEKRLLTVRDRLRTAERSPEEVEAAARIREDRARSAAAIAAAQKKQDRIARATTRRLAGQYLAPWERELLNSA